MLPLIFPRENTFIRILVSLGRSLKICYLKNVKKGNEYICIIEI